MKTRARNGPAAEFPFFGIIPPSTSLFAPLQLEQRKKGFLDVAGKPREPGEGSSHLALRGVPQGPRNTRSAALDNGPQEFCRLGRVRAAQRPAVGDHEAAAPAPCDNPHAKSEKGIGGP